MLLVLNFVKFLVLNFAWQTRSNPTEIPNGVFANDNFINTSFTASHGDDVRTPEAGFNGPNSDTPYEAADAAYEAQDDTHEAPPTMTPPGYSVYTGLYQLLERNGWLKSYSNWAESTATVWRSPKGPVWLVRLLHDLNDDYDEVAEIVPYYIPYPEFCSSKTRNFSCWSSFCYQILDTKSVDGDDDDE
eukprot:gene5519-5505_t